MEVERIIFFDGIGEIVYKKSKRAKRLTIRIKSATDLRVTIPTYVSYIQAEAFVFEKSSWIRQTIEKLKVRTCELTVFHELSEFSTLHHDLRIERIEGEKVKRKISIVQLSLMFGYISIARQKQPYPYTI